MSIVKLLEYEEGYRVNPYLCSNGYPTVGIGKKLGPKCSREDLKRLYTFKVPQPIARQWLLHDVQDISNKLSRHRVVGFAFNSCNLARKAVLISMAYQMGIEGLAGFKNMLSAIERCQFDNAEFQGLDSKWARSDSPERAIRQMWQMRSGEWLREYL